jgi:hypothetical protein
MKKFTLVLGMALVGLTTFAQTLETKFTSYSVVGQVSTTIGDGTITVTLADDVNIGESLTTYFTLSAGASASIGGVQLGQVSSTIVDYSSREVTFTVTNGDASQNWVVTVVGGYNSVKTNSAIEANVYPNPASDVLYIETENGAKISVLNVLGVAVKTTILEGSVAQLSTANLPKGTYLVVIEYNGQRTVKKVSVIR